MISSQPDQRESQWANDPAIRDQSTENSKENSVQDENQNPSTPALEFRNVSFSFDDEKVLDCVSFIVMRGEIKVILSGSGGGKSTILRLILGLLKPDEGQVLLMMKILQITMNRS